MALMSRFCTSCHGQVSMEVVLPGARRAYSSQGGSISTTSNLVPKVSGVKGSSLRSACRHPNHLNGGKCYVRE